MNHIKDDIEAIARLSLQGFTLDDSFDKYSRGAFPYFMYGHPVEINSRLESKKIGKVTKSMMYPLIALRADVVQERSGGLVRYNLNVAIFTNASAGLNAEERTEQKFKPILIPIYDRFIAALRSSGLFIWSGDPVPSHTYVERPFWGTGNDQGTTKKLFNDPVDCIELIDLKLNKRNC